MSHPSRAIQPAAPPRAGAGGAGGAVPAGDPADAREPPPVWAGFLLRWRWVLLAAWLLVHALAFNGLWRVGLDSAQYRHVARSLAQGEGYTILGQPQRQIYPGLPLLLAGLDRAGFGEAAWPGVLVMIGFAAATLAVVYALIRRLWPPWAATVVTAGVAFNGAFVKFSHELLTDVPFLLGVVLSLWGWEALSDRGRGKKVVAGAALLGGMGLAASMRPTFWVLAVALLLTCVGGLLVRGFPAAARRLAPASWDDAGVDRARSWKFYAVCLGVVVLVAAAFLVLDPRTRQFDPLGGGYEQENFNRLLDVAGRLRETPKKLWEMLQDNLESLFFAEQVTGLNVVFVAALLAGVWLVSRRRPLWGVLVGVLLLTLYVASTVPRYYLMVLPVLWAGWLCGVLWAARKLFVHPNNRGIFTGVTLGLVFACNVGHCVKLIVEQRSRPFLHWYEHGMYEPVAATAEVLRRGTEPGETTIGPFAPVMSYLSDRRVLGRRELEIESVTGMAARAEVVRDSDAQWMVFPHNVYEKKDKPLYRLTRIGVVAPTNESDEQALPVGEFDGIRWYVSPFGVDFDMLPRGESGKDAK